MSTSKRAKSEDVRKSQGLRKLQSERPQVHTRSMSVDQIDKRNKSAAMSFFEDIKSIFFHMPALQEGDEGEDSDDGVQTQSRSARNSMGDQMKKAVDLFGGISDNEDDDEK